MKILKYKAFCAVDVTSDLSVLPHLHDTKREAIADNTSYHGHPCDDPRKRGAICEVEVKIKVPKLAASRELIDYVQRFQGSPGLLVVGDPLQNKRARQSAKAEQQRALKVLKSKI